jgi:hypothetical protein
MKKNLKIFENLKYFLLGKKHSQLGHESCLCFFLLEMMNSCSVNFNFLQVPCYNVILCKYLNYWA